MQFGLNLYSIRNLIDTEEHFLDTAKKLREMGYESIQYSGGPFDAEMIARVSQKAGLPVVLTHVPYDRIVNNTDRLMREHERFHCRYIGLGSIAPDVQNDAKGFAEAVAALERASARMEENGFRFFYHHHHREFAKYGETTYFDYMVENAPHIHFTLDTYWLQYGGVDVCAVIDRMAGRAECLHLKDYKLLSGTDEKSPFAPTFAAVGDGTLDFAKIIHHAKLAGTEHFLVEEDDAALLPDPLAEVSRSIGYLRTHFADREAVTK